MLKLALLILMCLSCLLLCTTASAQTFTYADVNAAFDISSHDYTLITPDNLSLHPSWVAAQGIPADELAAQWREDGVLLVAVPVKGDGQITFSAVKNDESVRMFDLDQQSALARTNYRTAFSKNQVMQDEGYTFKNVDWVTAKNHGRFLKFNYKRVVDGKETNGYQYRTIRNGYTVVVDFSVSGRTVKSADRKLVDKIMNGFSFTVTMAKPATSVPAIILSGKPPLETNTGKFTISGTGEPGLKLTAVILRMSSPEPLIVEKTIGNSGKFSFNVKLPEEGVWLMTMTVNNGDVITEELVFNTTTYKKTLLPVNLTSDIPAVITGDTLTISGTTIGNVEVQCICGDNFAKTVKTNNSGKFTFKLDTKEAGEYDIVLVFAKRNFETRRYTYTANRIVTDEQFRDRCRKEAVKPAYNTLKSKLTGYTGRIMGYDLYVVDVIEDNGGYVIRMAMNKRSGNFVNVVLVQTDEMPDVEIGTKIKMYGRCVGELTVTLPDGTTETLPGFELLFFDK